MRRLRLTLLAFVILYSSFVSAQASPASIYVDTKTRAVTSQDGVNVFDASGLDFRLGNVNIVDASAIRTINLGGTNGTRITGKMIFFDGTTPIAQPTGNILTALAALHLVNSPSLPFSSLASRPTTIAGYGITDFNSLGDARWSALAHAHAFSALTAKPTTLAGYGITDNTFANLLSKPTTIAGFGITDFSSLGDARWSALAHAHSFSAITGKPTTTAGYGITDISTVGHTGVYSDLNSLPTLAATSSATSHFFLSAYNAGTGAFTQAQPAFTDVSGTAATGQIPDLDAAKIITGVFPKARVPGVTAYTDTANVYTQPQDFISHVTGSVTVRSLAAPAAPTVGHTGVAGATTWTYRIAAKLPDGTGTTASLGGSTATGNATLDNSNFNNLSWSAVAGAATYDVYRTVVGLVPSTTGKIANVAGLSYDDKGSAGDGAASPASNSTGNLAWLADNVSDVGNTSTGRPRDVNAARNVNAPGGVFTTATVGTNTVTGNQTVGGTIAAAGQINNLRWIDATKAPYNVDLTGVVNSTTGLTNALTDAMASGKDLYIPTGTVLYSSTLHVTSKVTIRGDGKAGQSTAGTVLKWTGGGAVPMIWFDTIERGGGLEDISLNGNDVASIGLLVDGCGFGYYHNIQIEKFAQTGLKTIAASHACFFNVFDTIGILSTTAGNSCMWISGNSPGEDTNQCTFRNIAINSGTRIGLRLGYSDENSFYDLSILNGNAAFPGVFVDPSETVGHERPNGNVFYRLLANFGGWVQPASASALLSQNVIYGYGTSNGEPAPVLNGTNTLAWTDEYGRFYTRDLNVRGPIVGVGDITAGVVGGLGGNFYAQNTSSTSINGFTVKGANYPSLPSGAMSFALGDSAAAGSIGGLPWLGTAGFYFTNVSRVVFSSNVNVPYTFSPNGSPMLEVTSGGVRVGGSSFVFSKGKLRTTVNWTIPNALSLGHQSVDATFTGVNTTDQIVISPQTYYGIMSIEILGPNTVRLHYWNPTGAGVTSIPNRDFYLTAEKFE